MALITVSGEPGCRPDEIGRMAAQRLGWELVTETRLQRLLAEEFGALANIPDKAWRHLVLSALARLALDHHLVTTASGSELLTPEQFPSILRVRLTAPESWRVGSVMLDRRLDRPKARKLLIELEKEAKLQTKRRFGRTALRPHESDLLLNAATLDAESMASLVVSAAAAMHLANSGFLSAGTEAQIQFRARFELSKHGMAPPHRVAIKRAAFVHPSEEIFANLLDFYRIAWEYEPRSFPIQLDTSGKVLEAFTPDFYLPEFNLYVELTTMKQAHVTKKNRKVKLLRAIYPEINIQVFYQKDFENLIFKYGLAERPQEVQRA